MEYKGYVGKVEFDEEAAVFCGEVINTRDVITFEGESVAELTQAFRDSVDDYLDFCKQRGEEPDKPFSGQFVTRISPELHREISLAAQRSGKSLNAWVAERLTESLVTLAGRTSVKKVKKNVGKKVGKYRRTKAVTKSTTKGVCRGVSES